VSGQRDSVPAPVRPAALKTAEHPTKLSPYYGFPPNRLRFKRKDAEAQRREGTARQDATKEFSREQTEKTEERKSCRKRTILGNGAGETQSLERIGFLPEVTLSVLHLKAAKMNQTMG
jgi:hypothetical protein